MNKLKTILDELESSNQRGKLYSTEMNSDEDGRVGCNFNPDFYQSVGEE